MRRRRKGLGVPPPQPCLQKRPRAAEFHHESAEGLDHHELGKVHGGGRNRGAEELERARRPFKNPVKHLEREGERE